MIAQNVREQFLADSQRTIPDQLVGLMGRAPLDVVPINAVRMTKLEAWFDRRSGRLAETLSFLVSRVQLAWKYRTSFFGFAIGSLRIVSGCPNYFKRLSLFKRVPQPKRQPEPFETSNKNPAYLEKCENAALAVVADVYPELKDHESLVYLEFSRRVSEIRRNGEIHRKFNDGTPYVVNSKNEPEWPISVASEVVFESKMKALKCS